MKTKINRKVTQANRLLAELGTTSAEVAASLRAKGITGLIGKAGHCPVSRLVRREVGFDHAFSAWSGSSVHVGRKDAWLEHPEPVRAFIADFDFHRYPELVG